MKGRPTTVAATWQSFDYEAAKRPEKFVTYWRDDAPGEPPAELRASLSPQRLTVWLPSGSRVQCMRNRREYHEGRHVTRRFMHYYRDRWNNLHRIVFMIPKHEDLNA